MYGQTIRTRNDQIDELLCKRQREWTSSVLIVWVIRNIENMLYLTARIRISNTTPEYRNVGVRWHEKIDECFWIIDMTEVNMVWKNRMGSCSAIARIPRLNQLGGKIITEVYPLEFSNPRYPFFKFFIPRNRASIIRPRNDYNLSLHRRQMNPKSWSLRWSTGPPRGLTLLPNWQFPHLQHKDGSNEIPAAEAAISGVISAPYCWIVKVQVLANRYFWTYPIWLHLSTSMICTRILNQSRSLLNFASFWVRCRRRPQMMIWDSIPATNPVLSDENQM